MIRPRSAYGRNSAERAPTTTERFARRIAAQVRARVRGVSSECHSGRPHAEALLEAVEELRRSARFPASGSATAAAADGFRHGLEIDFGLAGAGDAVEQRDAESRRWPPAPAARRAAVRCWPVKSGCGERRIGRRRRPAPAARTTVSSVPSSTSPSITPALTPASCAASDLPCSSPSASSVDQPPLGPASCASARPRPGARRSAPARARDVRPSAAPCRSTMPRGDSV